MYGHRDIIILMNPRVVTTVDHEIMGGVPCVTGTRIPVTTILTLLGTGMTPTEVIADYPQLNVSDIHSCLRYAALAVDGRITGRIGGMSELTGKYSITMPQDIAGEARARSGPSGLSAYVSAAVARQLERDKLQELNDAFEAEHGPVTEEELSATRQQLAQARRDQGVSHRDVA